MQPTGWIKIDRNIRNHWLWQNPRHLQWWLDLLMLAQYRDTRMQFGNSIVTIPRGCIPVSVRDLCTRWSYTGDDRRPHTPSTKTVHNFLNLLQAEGMISKQMLKLPNRETLISICNYDSYQTFETPSENTSETLGKHLGNTIKEIKEVDEVNGARPRVREEDSPNQPLGQIDPATQNETFLQKFFDPSRQASLEARTQKMHLIDPAISTIEDLRNLARECLDEWILRGQPPKPNYREWASHLIRHIETKARANRDRQLQPLTTNPGQNVTPNPNIRTDSFADARRRGDEEFARFVAQKLQGAGLH